VTPYIHAYIHQSAIMMPHKLPNVYDK